MWWVFLSPLYGQWPRTRRRNQVGKGSVWEGGESDIVCQEWGSQRVPWEGLMCLSVVGLRGKDPKLNWSENRRKDGWPKGLVWDRGEGWQPATASLSELASSGFLPSNAFQTEMHLALVALRQDGTCLCPGWWSVAFTKQMSCFSEALSKAREEHELGRTSSLGSPRASVEKLLCSGSHWPVPNTCENQDQGQKRRLQPDGGDPLSSQPWLHSEPGDHFPSPHPSFFHGASG